MSSLLRVFVYDMAGNKPEAHVPGDATVNDVTGVIKRQKGVRRLSQRLYSVGTKTILSEKRRIYTLAEWTLGDLIPDPDAQGLPPCPHEDVHLQLAVVNIAPDCGYCGQPAKRLCEGCRRLLYCDHTCQGLHWSTHKRECQRASLTQDSEYSTPTGWL